MAIPKHPGSHTRKLCTHFWSSLPQLVGVRVDNENLGFQIMGNLCSIPNCCFWSCADRGGEPPLPLPLQWSQTSPAPNDRTYRVFRRTGLSLSLSLSLWSCCTACGILVPRPEMETVPPAVEAQSPNQWTSREVPGVCFFLPSFFPFSPFGNHTSQN